MTSAALMVNGGLIDPELNAEIDKLIADHGRNGTNGVLDLDTGMPDSGENEWDTGNFVPISEYNVCVTD